MNLTHHPERISQLKGERQCPHIYATTAGHKETPCGQQRVADGKAEVK
jgi:hypothetical protein